MTNESTHRPGQVWTTYTAPLQNEATALLKLRMNVEIAKSMIYDRDRKIDALTARLAAAEKNQRTPGTVEQCDGCGRTNQWWNECCNAACPIRKAQEPKP